MDDMSSGICPGAGTMSPPAPGEGGMPQNPAQGCGMGHCQDSYHYGYSVLLVASHAKATKHHKKKKK
jgi:hypothetical protein